MKRCVLCKSMATIYRDSDMASLCWACDTKVHSANFLVARHSRSLLCQICQSQTTWSSSGEKLCRSAVAICGTCGVSGEDVIAEGVGGDDEIDFNRVFAWPPPPEMSCSSSEEVGVGSLKRKRQKVADYNSHEEEIDSSSLNITHYKPSSTVGAVGDRKKLRDWNMISDENMHAPFLRMG